MADVQVFFNRLECPLDLSPILADISSAQKRVAIASAWFTDTDLAIAFIESQALCKVAIMNHYDLAQNYRKAVDLLAEYFDGYSLRRFEINTLVNRVVKDFFVVEEILELELPPEETASRVESVYAEIEESVCLERNTTRQAYLCSQFSGIVSAGNSDWQDGIMHHKFVVADDVVWTGSFNFTLQARKNLENLVRIADREVSNLFWQEAMFIKDTGGYTAPEGGAS